jgi:hypothetical protein
MDVITRRALKGLNVEAQGAGRNPRQRGSCLARGAKWSDDDHDASPWIQAGALQNSQSPVDTRGGGDGTSIELQKFRRCPVLLTFQNN